MQRLIDTINKLEPLQEGDYVIIEAMQKIAHPKTLKKGDFIFTRGDTPPISVYVCSGMLRHFVSDNNGNEKIIQFFMEEAFFDDCGSYVNNQPIDYYIQAIEDCEIIYFYLDELKEMAAQSPVIERIGVKIANSFLKNHQEHITILMKYNPEERYKYLMQNKPEFVQRVSVTHLAQFLDLSRETLSRMRSRFAEQHIL
jgi:CRP/FNR family transcriptional regulator, anaerobic regulatory protein